MQLVVIIFICTLVVVVGLYLVGVAESGERLVLECVGVLVVEDVELAAGHRVVPNGKLVRARLQVPVELVLRQDALYLPHHRWPVRDALLKHPKLVDISL